MLLLNLLVYNVKWEVSIQVQPSGYFLRETLPLRSSRGLNRPIEHTLWPSARTSAHRAPQNLCRAWHHRHTRLGRASPEAPPPAQSTRPRAGRVVGRKE